MPGEPEPQMSTVRAVAARPVIEPRATTMVDLMLLTVGIACASALPSGLSWFNLRYHATTLNLEFVVSILIWGACLGTVGVAFAVIGRHAIYRRDARPAEWLAIALAARYSSLAITELHAQHGSASILVAEMESGWQADLGSPGRMACAAVIFVIIVFYVGVLFRYAKLRPFLRSLLGASVALLWYWGPCDIWGRETMLLMLEVTQTETLYSHTLIPAFSVTVLPLVLAYWAVFSGQPWKKWTHLEFVAMACFGGMIGLMYFHPFVRGYHNDGWFFVGVAFFVVMVNLFAAPLGWCAAQLYHNLVENHPETRGAG